MTCPEGVSVNVGMDMGVDPNFRDLQNGASIEKSRQQVKGVHGLLCLCRIEQGYCLWYSCGTKYIRRLSNGYS